VSHPTQTDISLDIPSAVKRDPENL
jgi:hypothetical protein